MEIEKAKAIIEAILFACGREVGIKELMSALEVSSEDLFAIIESMKQDYQKEDRGIEIIKVGEAFQLTTKKEYYEYIYPIYKEYFNDFDSSLDKYSVYGLKGWIFAGNALNNVYSQHSEPITPNWLKVKEQIANLKLINILKSHGFSDEEIKESLNNNSDELENEQTQVKK